MANILRSVGESLPISINPTFNHGAYELTPVTYRHPFIKSKSKNITGIWSEATLLGPTMIHLEKTEEVFDIGLTTIARKKKTVNSRVRIITDGKIALINACKSNFHNSLVLRCTLHFKDDCKKFLQSVGITGERNQVPLLDMVFGAEDLIEAEDKQELDTRLTAMEGVIRD